MNDPVKYLAVVDERANEVWRIPVEGMANDAIFSLGLYIVRTLAPGYGLSAVR